MIEEEEPPPFEVRLLGPFETSAHGVALSLKPQTAQLLALLAVHANEPVTRSAIIEAIWDKTAPDVKDTANQIQVHVRTIRKALSRGDVPAGAVEFVGAGRYKLHSPPVSTDLAQFNRKLAAARESLIAGLLPQASQTLTEALSLGQGVALDGIDGIFAEAESANLEERKLGVLLDRIDIDLWCERFVGLVPELARLAGIRRTDDRFRMRLMIALHGSDRTPEALEAFRVGRQIINDELGLEPGPQLQAAHADILRSTPVCEMLSKFTPLPGRTRAGGDLGYQTLLPRHLPADVSNFTGRATELGELDLALTAVEPSSMVVSIISGPGGVGKTALAVAWAHRVGGEFPDGHLYLDLRGYGPGQPMDPADGLAHLLEALGTLPKAIPESADARALMYRSRLAGKRALIVLDNAASAGQVRPLLPGSAGCAVIVTSRSSLSGLAARDGARRIDVSPLPLGDAVDLLRQIIGDAVITAEPQTVADAAQSCGCLPLALRIAAERAAARPAMTLADLASELASEHRRLDILATPGGDLATSVRLVFSWSYRALQPPARRVFRLLGLLHGPDIGIPAAAALCATSPASMRGIFDELLSEHLLEEIAPGRYRCHDLLRLYAAECASADETPQERHEAIRNMLTWYLRTSDAADRILLPRHLHVQLSPAEASQAPLKFATPAQAHAWCETEQANLVAAVREAAEYGLFSIAWKLSAALWGFFFLRKPWTEWKLTYEIGLESARHASDPYGEALMLFGLGTVHWSMQQPGQAVERYEQALPAWQQIGHLWGEAMTWNNLGAAHSDLGQFSQVLKDFRRALQIRRSIGDARGQAQTMINIGEALFQLGRFPASHRQAQAALALCEKLGYTFGEAMSLYNLAASAMKLGQPSQALRHLQRSLELRRELGDQQGEAEALTRLGEVQQSTGDHSAACKSWHRALGIFEQIGDPQADIVRGYLCNPASGPRSKSGS